MNQHTTQQSSNTFTNLAAIFIGAAVPMVFTGRAILGVSIALALVFAFLCPNRKQFTASFRTVLNQPASWLLLGVVIAWIPNLFATPTPDKSIETLTRTMALILIVGFTYVALHSGKAFHDKALKAFLVCSFIFPLIVILILFFRPELKTLFMGLDWKVPLIGKNYKPAAAAGALMIPVLIWASWTYTGKWKVLALLSCILLVVVMIKTRNRAAFAGLLAAFALYVVLDAFHRHNLTRVALTILIFMICITAVLLWLYNLRSALPFPDYDWLFPPWLVDWHRQSIWSFAWEQGSDNRWFGTGINAIDKLDGSRRPSQFIASETSIPFHPHNWAVEIMIETGFVGIISLLGFITYAMHRMIKLYFRTSSNAMMGALCVWAAYWSSGLFNFSFWSVWWQASFMLLTTLCLAGHTHRELDGQDYSVPPSPNERS